MAAAGAARPAISQTAPLAEAPTQLESITVTATRRSEDLQSVPVDVSVISGGTVQQSGIHELSDLKDLSASLNYTPITTNGGGYQIRGIGANTFDNSVEQGVSVVVDDVVMLFHQQFGLLGLNDIQQVEILKGPQGMLFGKNADSGVISVTTQQPQLGTLFAFANAEYGTRNDRNINAKLNIPLSDTMAVSASAFSQGEGGPGFYTAPTLQHERQGNTQENGVRAKLLYRPWSNLSFTLSGDYASHQDNAARVQGVQTNAALLDEQIAYDAAPGIHQTNNADSTASYYNRGEYGTSLKVDYEFSGYSLTSISAWRQASTTQNFPVDMVPSFYFPINLSTAQDRQVTQEIRLASPRGRLLEYVAGVYYADVQEDTTIQQAGQLGKTSLPLNTYQSLTNGENHQADGSTSAAAFAQGLAHLTDRLSLSAGLRYTHDRQTASLIQLPVGGYTQIDIGAKPTAPSGAVDGSNVSYRASLAYKITPDFNVYGTYATGYKAPGVAYITAIRHPFLAEHARLWEAGIKSLWLGQTLRLNLGLYDERYTDFQASELTQIGPILAISINNAGELRTRGVDMDLEYRATDNLSFVSTTNFSNAVYVDYRSGANDYDGDPYPNAPRWSSTLGARAWQSPRGTYRITEYLNYSYRSAVIGIVGNPLSRIPGHGDLAMRLGLEPADGKWGAGLYGRNLLDQTYPTGVIAFNGILQSFTPDARRTIGAYINFNF
ncbi:MAG TPA: TonB-dependent receptor [Steroidobacteraceae bacterium]